MCAGSSDGICPEIVFVEQAVRYHPDVSRLGNRQQPRQRLLNHRLVAIECQHLLRAGAAAARPESRSTSARKNYRSETR